MNDHQNLFRLSFIFIEKNVVILIVLGMIIGNGAWYWDRLRNTRHRVSRIFEIHFGWEKDMISDSIRFSTKLWLLSLYCFSKWYNFDDTIFRSDNTWVILNELYLYGKKLNFYLPTQKQLSLDFPSLKSWDAQTFSLKNLIMHTKLVKGMGFAWVFHPFLCGFKQKIGKEWRWG